MDIFLYLFLRADRVSALDQNLERDAVLTPSSPKETWLIPN